MMRTTATELKANGGCVSSDLSTRMMREELSRLFQHADEYLVLQPDSNCGLPEHGYE